MNKLFGLLFTFAYIVLAFFMAILGSVHGPRLFPYFVLGYLILALGALWWLGFYIPRRVPKRASATLAVCGLGIGTLLVLASSASQGPLVNWEFRRMQKKAAATEVLNLRDETLLVREAVPIGIRLKYSMRFPDGDYFWQSPFLTPQTDLGHFVAWNIVQETIEPPMTITASSPEAVAIETAQLPPVTRRYEPGKIYNFTVDLVPGFLALSSDRTRVCIVPAPAQDAAAMQKLLSAQNSERYKVTVSGTNFSGLTQNAYDLKTFWDATLNSGAPQCKYLNGRISFR